MKKYCKNLFFFTIGILFAAVFVSCEKPKEYEKPKEDAVLKKLLTEEDDDNPYMVGNDGTRHYGLLQAHGDYTKLKLISRSNKKDYEPGESVGVRFFARNDSDGEIHLNEISRVTPFFHLWELRHSNGDAVVKTSKGEEWFQECKKAWPNDDRFRFSTMKFGGHDYIKLQPGQELKFLGGILLSDYFDLSKPDTYELTCFQPTFINGQYYDPPLQSNTLTFRVLENVEKVEVKEADINPSQNEEVFKFDKLFVVADWPDMNPPPGKEVFKQDKPPKNVFYNPSNGQPLDVSPEMYFRLRAKEQE